MAVKTLDVDDPQSRCGLDARGVRVETQQHDLNGDGVPELLVNQSGSQGCFGRAGGLIHLLVADGQGGWRRDLGFSAEYVLVQPRDDGGWSDIAVQGVKGCQAIWRNDGDQYRIWKTCDDRGRQVFAEGRVDDAAPARVAASGAGVPGIPAATVAVQQAMLDERLAPMDWVDPASLRGEDGDAMPYEHNGSIVLVSPKKGLIVYQEPSRAMRDTVKPGTVLFRGPAWDRDKEDVWIKGKAFVFRKGCPAAGYDVRGSYSVHSTVRQFTLEGMAPTRVRSSCSLNGFEIESTSARMAFSAAWD